MEMMKKWHALWLDNRHYFKRLAIAALPCFLMSFMLFLFGPLDIMAANIRFLPLYVNDFLIPYIKLTLCVWIGMSLILAMLHGKVFDWLLCAIFGLSVCMYLQGTFLNLDLGTLDGNAIDWNIYWQHGLWNMVIWIGVFLLIFCVHYFFKSRFNGIVVFVCILLIVMQGTGLVYSVSTVEKPESKLFISGDEQYAVSDKENIILIALDSFSNYVMDKVLQADNTALDAFRDFTYYDNMNTGYYGTFPGVLHLLTGWEYLWNESYEENRQKAWETERTKQVYSTLQKNGYDCYAFLPSPAYLANKDLSIIQYAFENVEDANRSSVSAEVIKQFVQLAMYRYAPHAMKANFWMYTGDIKTSDGEENIVRDDYKFYDALKEQRLYKISGNKRFIFQLLIGAHGPYKMDRNGNYVEEGTDKYEQARGYLLVVEEYINQLKELGVYDNATIIITADHGSATRTQSILLVKEKMHTGTQIVRNSTPVNQSEIMTTVLASVGLPYDGIGVSIYDIDPELPRARTTFVWGNDENYPEIPNGKYNVFYEYTYTGDGSEIDRVIKEQTNMKVHELCDSYY